MTQEKPLEPVKGSWDVEITRTRKTTLEEEAEINEHARELASMINDETTKRTIPESIGVITFRKFL